MTVRVNASNDFFVRTTDDRHKARVQEFLQRIYDRGEIFEGLRGPLLHALRVVLHEAELVEGLCPQHGIPPEFVEEKNYFFASPPTKSAFCGCTTTGRISCFRGFLQRGAQLHRAGAGRHQRQPCLAALGRSPWDTSQVVYVWDALINYWSALAR